MKNDKYSYNLKLNEIPYDPNYLQHNKNKFVNVMLNKYQ
jgi:hypothetical protein